ncbi:SurA N-terminal domain-containing protein [Denitrificimonas sp. JX-1]|uniref:Periplasmic chaperone PpiD n=1 Tax=Denitrificimonas halotolerans TaxID=3098930 RepID=A0ABU5GRL0_9GAMM|nr:SurA N-terminal domain-containing protein [Denitrificimonas sp. JX-1]MDY7219624.1 SurA N-terminal domain-containing protein [Denitrificimonas sp. JX-1]
MLQNIRDHSTGWISKSIIGLIVVLFAFTGFDAIIGATSNSNNAAKVNGEEITLDALVAAKNLQRRQLAQQFGDDFDVNQIDDKLLTEAALQGLIARKLLVQSADQAGFVYPSSAVDQFILTAQEFQVDGQFNADRFDQVIRQMGYTRLQFRQMIEEEMRTSQLRAGIAGSAFVTAQEAQEFARLERQTRDFTMLVIEPDIEQASVSEEEVQTYYNENPTQFMTADQVIVEYIELEKSTFFDDVIVEQADLKELYEAEIANLSEQRRAAHILIEVAGDRSDEQARDTAEQAIARINAGEDFAAIAQELSDDIGSAQDGGDLGFAAAGIYEPEFEDALFALGKEQLSEPVRTQFGWHVIKLLDIRPADIPSFASLEEKLTQNLKAREVEQRFVEAVRDLEGYAYESADLQQPAAEMGLTVKVSEPIGREGTTGIFANRKVLDAAFSPEVLEEGANSLVIELDPETSVVLRVKEHQRPEPIAFSDVSEQIKQQLIEQRATENAKSDGEALLATFKADKASIVGDEWQTVEAATRMQDRFDPQVLQTLFKMPKPHDGQVEFAGVSLNSGDYVLLRLTGVNDSPAPLDAQELAQYQQALAARTGQVDFDALLQQMELDAKVERF